MPYVQRKIITEMYTFFTPCIVHAKLQGKHATFDITKFWVVFLFFPDPNLFLLSIIFIVLY